MQPTATDEIPGTSVITNERQATTPPQERSVWISDNINEEKSEDTCCHRATFCLPVLRNIIVTDVISTCLGIQLIWADLFWLATTGGIILYSWLVLYFLLGDMMLPDGPLFGFFILVVSAYLLGWALTLVPFLHLPPIFGMLLAGIVIRNTDFYNVHDEIGPGVTSKIRTFCLTFIMIRAGLQLTITALKEHPVFVLTLAFIPCTMEMLTVTVVSGYVLQYPWEWAFLTGTIIACMSPSVTINSMLTLAEQGYGQDKELSSLLGMAITFEDIHIMSLFTIAYSFVFSNDEKRTEWWSYIPGGFRDLLLAVIVGSILGFALAFFPHRNHKYTTPFRIVGLILASLMCTTAARKLTITGGGYLATIILSFIAVRGWRLLAATFDTTAFVKTFYFLWHFMQPILGSVIGAEIDFQHWSATRAGRYLVCLLIGLFVRSGTTYLMTIKMPFSWKERLFISITCVAKGTIQAALAPIAYERARKETDPRNLELALDVMRLSVLAITLFAPLGAIIIMTTGPILLNKLEVEEYQRQRQLSYAHTLSIDYLKNNLKTNNK